MAIPVAGAGETARRGGGSGAPAGVPGAVAAVLSPAVRMALAAVVIAVTLLLPGVRRLALLVGGGSRQGAERQQSRRQGDQGLVAGSLHGVWSFIGSPRQPIKRGPPPNRSLQIAHFPYETRGTPRRRTVGAPPVPPLAAPLRDAHLNSIGVASRRAPAPASMRTTRAGPSVRSALSFWQQRFIIFLLKGFTLASF